MPKTRKRGGVAQKQAPPRPSKSLKRKASQNNQGANKRKATQKTPHPPKPEVIPWRRWVKGGQNQEWFVSRITGMAFNPAGNLEEIATVPFQEKDLPLELWIKIFLYMDAPTTTIFSYTNSFWFWHAQPFKKGEQELYDPQSLYNPEKPFPVPPTYWYLDNDGKSVWLRGLIESIMVPTHVFDCFVGWYRKAEDREEMEEAHRQGMMDMVTQTRRANAERARELRAQTWADRNARTNQRERHVFRNATIQQTYDVQVDAMEAANAGRATRRRDAYLQLMNDRDSDDNNYSLDDLDPDDMPDVSSDEEIPDPNEFLYDNNLSDDETSDGYDSDVGY